MKKVLVALMILIVFLLPSTLGGEAVVGKTDVRLTLLNQDPDPALPGDVVDVRIKVENFGSDSISNLEVTFKPEFPLRFVTGESAKQTIRSLGSRQIEENGVILKWKIQVDDTSDESQGLFDLAYKIEELTITDEDFVIDIDQGELVLSVVSVESIPSDINPGGNAKVHIAIANLKNTAINDVRLKLVLDDVPFTIFGTSNEKVIERLLGKEKKTVSFDLLADADADLQAVSVPLNISFLDDSNSREKLKVNFGLKIREPPSYVFNLEQTTIRLPGNRAKAVISLSNTGVGNMKFVTAEMLSNENFEILSSEKLYLGNLESDDFETAEYEIFVNEKYEGDLPLLFKIEYKDDFNEPYADQEEVSVRVFDKASAKRFGYLEASNATSTIFLASIGGLIAVFWLFMFFDLMQSSMKKDKKYLWALAMILGTLLGAIAYFFLGRKKKQG